MNPLQRIGWLCCCLLLSLFLGGCPEPRLDTGMSDQLLLSSLRPGASNELLFQKLDADSVPTLLQVLHHKNDNLRTSAALALAQFPAHSGRIVPALLQTASQDEDRFVRSAAIETLGKLGLQTTKRVLPGLVNALKDQEEVVQLHALGALQRLGQSAVTAAPALLQYLQHNPQQQVQTLQTFESFGSAAIPVLLKGMGHHLASIRAVAALGLGRLQHSAGTRTSLFQIQKTLFHALQDRSVRVRNNAALSLIRRKTSTLPAALLKAGHLKTIAQWLQHEQQQEWMSHEAAWLVVEATKSRNPRLAAFATFLLRELEHHPKQTALQLKRWLQHPHRSLRLLAILSYTLLGSHSQPAVAALTRLAGSTDTLSREYVIRLLGLLGDRAIKALPVLARQLSHKSVQIRLATLEALQKMSLHRNLRHTMVRPLLQDMSWQVRCRAAWLLHSKESHNATRKQLHRFLQKNRCNRQQLQRVRQGIRRSFARPLPALLKALTDRSTLIRRHAAMELMLYHQKERQNFEKLYHSNAVQKALKDRDWRVRLRMLRWLGLFKDSARSQFALFRALQDSQWRVRAMAVQVLLSSPPPSPNPPQAH